MATSPCSSILRALAAIWLALAGSQTNDSSSTPVLSLVQAASPGGSAASSGSDMRNVIERYTTDQGGLDRSYNISLSENRSARLERFYQEQRRQLEAVDFAALPHEGRIDYLLLANELRHELAELAHEQARQAEAKELISFAPAIVGLEEARRRMEAVDGPSSAKVLTDVTRQIAEQRELLDARLQEPTPGTQRPGPVVARRAARFVDELRGTLKNWHGFYAGYDPVFTWWMRQPYGEAEKALKEYASFLREKLAGFVEGADDPVIGDPIGREALLAALEHEMIAYSPEELIEIAEKEFAWCDAEYRRAARELGFGEDWRKALDHVSQLHVKPGEQPQLIKQLAQEAVDFLEQRELVSIPPLCKEIWRMEMMSPERQKVNPFFTGGEVISVSFPTDTMNHEDKLMSLRGNNIHFSRATVHHELIPGHHLQGYMAQRHNTHRRAFRTPFLVEGWALYWEMLLWDLGFPKTPEDRVGMLFWRSHRCARIIFSLKFHLGQMTPQECIDFLVERVGHEWRNATGEVRRSFAGNYSPLYQAAYLLGGLQLRALRAELVPTGRLTDREFHDAILRENAIPIEMIRASLMQRPLARNEKPAWRFYEVPLAAQRTSSNSASGQAQVEQNSPKPAASPKVYLETLEPHWFAGGAKFWYRRDLPSGRRDFIVVDAAAGTRLPAFDHPRAAAALSKVEGRTISADQLPVTSLRFDENAQTVTLTGQGRSWKLDLATYEATSEPAGTEDGNGLPIMDRPRPSRRTGPETEIEFVNRLAEEIQLFWMDPDGNRQPYGRIAAGATHRQHTFSGHVWVVVRSGGEVAAVFEAEDLPRTALIGGRQTARRASPQRPSGESPRSGAVSPDGRWEAFVNGHNLFLRDPTSRQQHRLTHDANPNDTFARDASRDRAVGMRYNTPDPPSEEAEVFWSPDSRWLVAIRTRPGTERTVYMVESSPKDQLQPKLQSYPYLKPGDEIPVREPRLFDVAARTELSLDESLFPNPWSISDIRWSRDSSRFTFLYNQRGHQVLRIIAVEVPKSSEAPVNAVTQTERISSEGHAAEPRTAESAAAARQLIPAERPARASVRALVDEQSPTFISYSGKFFAEHLEESDEILWMSERDGWNHLYLYDARSSVVKNQITRGSWVVRNVDRVDREKRLVWFRAGGVHPGQDPYHVHYGRVRFDGTGLLFLTESDGTHSVQFSPDRRYFIDTCSRVDLPPVHELRRAEDGRLVCHLEQAEASELFDAGWRPPERFAAKGRDGLTDIYGIIHRPRSLDTSKAHPVIESIYAGPHSSHVPKAFQTSYRQERLAEQGFIVVQIDGMGTSNRSKPFHDVCWKNLGDAGFPDRILWMKAAAARYPYMDLSRVGIYGGSAGGQNALRALLAHGDFYKAAAADCGCHDNRMDKIWWNEQWMGWPVGPHYEEQSNVTQAHRLQGKLLLTVGELDRNVDPASTMQVVDALIKANKDFELIVFPGAGHGAGGSPYGERRRTEFFVRHLLGGGQIP